MDMQFSEADQAFRQEVRDFLATELPDDIGERWKSGSLIFRTGTMLSVGRKFSIIGAGSRQIGQRSMAALAGRPPRNTSLKPRLPKLARRR